MDKRISLCVEASELGQRPSHRSDTHVGPDNLIGDDNDDAQALQNIVRAWAANVVNAFSGKSEIESR